MPSLKGERQFDCLVEGVVMICLSLDCWLSASAPIYLFKVGCRELALVKPILNKLIEPVGFANNRVFLLFLLMLL